MESSQIHSPTLERRADDLKKLDAKIDLIENPTVSREDEQAVTSRRGLASASEETRERVAKSGGNAPHGIRGLQALPPEIRIAIARKGGLARGIQRRKMKQPKENTGVQTFST